MPNDPLIEEYVEKFEQKFDGMRIVSEPSDNEKIILNLLDSFRTSLKEYGDKRVGEVLSRVKELPTICGWCNKAGVNTFGECQCSYEESRYVKKSDVLSLITQKQ